MLTAIDALRESRFEFIAVAPEEGPLAEALHLCGLQHVPFNCRDGSGQRLPRETLLPRLLAILRTIGPRLVHANSLSMGRLVGAIANDLHIPTSAHLRDILRLSAGTVAELNRNTALLAVSEATREFHIAQGLDAARTRVVYNGVDCRQFRPEPRRNELRQSLGIAGEALLALTVGQIGPRKGLDVLLDAAILVHSQGRNLHYVLVGTRNSSKEESVNFERALFMRIAAEPFADRFHVLGERRDVDELMRNVDLLVHPARQEPLGRVLLEAAASGLPIVATDVGGTREILEDGVSARLVPPDDATALADAIIEMCDNSQRGALYGKAARNRAVEMFSSPQAARNLEAVWRELL